MIKENKVGVVEVKSSHDNLKRAKKQISNIISLLEKKLGNVNKKKITILGTSFKPETDDIRDSISIKLIRKLVEKGASVTALVRRNSSNILKNIDHLKSDMEIIWGDIQDFGQNFYLINGLFHFKSRLKK